jgi:hypothetical protein
MDGYQKNNRPTGSSDAAAIPLSLIPAKHAYASPTRGEENDLWVKSVTGVSDVSGVKDGRF